MSKLGFDVIVIGGGIAGSTCAALAARKGLRVALVEKTASNKTAPTRFDWLPRPALTFFDQLDIDHQAILRAPFQGASFHSADLAKQADTTEQEPPAFRIDYTDLVRKVKKQAVASGATIIVSPSPAVIEPGEQNVTATFTNHKPVTARFLICADGVNPTSDRTKTADKWIAQLCVPGRSVESADRLHWVVGLDQGRTLATWWSDGPMLTVRLHTDGPTEKARARLHQCVTTAMQRKLLVIDAAFRPEEIALSPAPSPSALEIDSHVGKRQLSIGDAGGFVASSTREGIYPAMWSASLAADTLGEAIACDKDQDTLQTFDTLWRTTMAEYLGSPEMETPFLLPLVFSNPQMAQRMARAFWHGRQT